MKVRLFNTAALAAAILATQGHAQQGEDSLERALADLNEGLTLQGDANSGPVWGGYFRARNRLYDNGMETNGYDVDVVATISMLFNINEDARVFAEINDSATFGDDTFGGTSMGVYDDRRNGTFDVPRFYAEVDSLVGLGGTAKIGRDEYHVGSGRIIGTDHWDNVPTTHAGIWYDNEVIDDFLSIHTSLTNDIDTGNVDENDARLWVLAAPMNLDVGEGIEVTPYFLRYDGAASIGGTPLFGGGESGTWMGADANGEILGFNWDVEVVDFSSGDFGGVSFAVDLRYGLKAAESLAFIEDGEVFFRFSSSDEEFAVLTPTYHNAAGFSDRLGAGGQFTAGTDLFGLGIGVVPAEGWDGALAFYSVEQEVGLFNDEWTEIDLSVGTELGGGVQSWFGLAFVDPDAGDSEMVFWTTLDVYFGSELPAAPAP